MCLKKIFSSLNIKTVTTLFLLMSSLLLLNLVSADTYTLNDEIVDAADLEAAKSISTHKGISYTFMQCIGTQHVYPYQDFVWQIDYSWCNLDDIENLWADRKIRYIILKDVYVKLQPQEITSYTTARKDIDSINLEKKDDYTELQISFKEGAYESFLVTVCCRYNATID